MGRRKALTPQQTVDAKIYKKIGEAEFNYNVLGYRHHPMKDGGTLVVMLPSHATMREAWYNATRPEFMADCKQQAINASMER